jgi:hypothetical protein
MTKSSTEAFATPSQQCICTPPPIKIRAEMAVGTKERTRTGEDRSLRNHHHHLRGVKGFSIGSMESTHTTTRISAFGDQEEN